MAKFTQQIDLHILSSNMLKQNVKSFSYEKKHFIFNIGH